MNIIDDLVPVADFQNEITSKLGYENKWWCGDNLRLFDCEVILAVFSSKKSDL